MSWLYLSCPSPVVAPCSTGRGLEEGKLLWKPFPAPCRGCWGCLGSSKGGVGSAAGTACQRGEAVSAEECCCGEVAWEAGHSREHFRLNEGKNKGRDAKAFSFDVFEGSKRELLLQNTLFSERGRLKSVKQTVSLHLTPSLSQMLC